jgi:geranylgeranyl pyrophosphate synthase
MCGLTEIIHNGSLMVDDIEDKSLKRRGLPCTYIKYGEDVAINTGTLMYYSPIMKLNNYILNLNT